MTRHSDSQSSYFAKFRSWSLNAISMTCLTGSGNSYPSLSSLSRSISSMISRLSFSASPFCLSPRYYRKTAKCLTNENGGRFWKRNLTRAAPSHGLSTD